MIGSAPLPVVAALVVRTTIIMVVVLVGLRLTGKRQLGQFNIYDLSLVMLIANAVQNAMTAGRGELAVGFASAGVLLLIGRIMSWLFVRMPQLEDQLAGTPTVLVNHGKLVKENLRRECVSEDEVFAAMRQHGLTHPGDASLVLLEVDGSISVVPKKPGTADGHKKRIG